MSNNLDWYDLPQNKCPKCNSMNMWKDLIHTPIHCGCSNCQYVWWQKLDWETVFNILEHMHELQKICADGELWKPVDDELLECVNQLLKKYSAKYECTLEYIHGTPSGTIFTKWETHNFEFISKQKSHIRFLDLKWDTVRVFVDHPPDGKVYIAYIIL